ncbi:MAG: TolC family protein [Bacteroidetes bacterium]|nr:TolC family protein [Bacteroidota bacterium]
MKNPSPQRKCIRMLGLLPVLLALLLAPKPASAQGLEFNSLDDLLTYADAHSAVTKSADAQTELARLQNAAAIANTVNLRGTASVTATNNFALPVNFLPAEIFGGPAGTFRQVTFGQQFVNVASIAPQLDVVNPSTWARVGSARSSAELTATTNALNRRNQHENIATTYCNLGSVTAQQEAAEANLRAADSIVSLVQNRFDAGIGRLQDLNNAKVNRANLSDFVQQLEVRKAQQILSLKGLLGMPPQEVLTYERLAPVEANAYPTPANSQLLRKQAAYATAVQRSELLANRLAFLPTFSIVAGFNWQQNSNEKMFNSADWIDSRFVGFKLSVPLPTETKLWSQAEDFRINLRLKEINSEQAALQETLQNQQLDLEIRRATEALVNAESIAKLKEENYRLSSNNYLEGILSLDQLLTAFTDKTNAILSKINAEWNLQLQLNKLGLNQLADSN